MDIEARRATPDVIKMVKEVLRISDPDMQLPPEPPPG
jgi:hypothetical protein